ncbi:hypothetical protein AMS68_002039 [Peltaster fructicola]|uniref:Uncharacterized protein n=1 Tax=Peltaster fructicola TaxID=286661 RepID=A0A6H0XP34_9PEZI|nr:hypothetical protein AMS68_002039 [Peltaster fructicola]
MGKGNLHDDHQRKKQFQPSISSYFDKPTTTSSPPLPAETQASLINVGMRVRKSVPEGYKTHKTVMYSSDLLESQPALSQPTLQRGYSRELTPFSGIHKVGDYAQQEQWSSSAPALLNETSFGSSPLLNNSQTTISSTNSFKSQDTASRKRSYEEDMEESMDAFFDEMEQEDEIVARKILQPKTYSRKQRMLDLLNSGGDFPDAHFLRPESEIDMSEEYT